MNDEGVVDRRSSKRFAYPLLQTESRKTMTMISIPLSGEAILQVSEIDLCWDTCHCVPEDDDDNHDGGEVHADGELRSIATNTDVSFPPISKLEYQIRMTTASIVDAVSTSPLVLQFRDNLQLELPSVSSSTSPAKLSPSVSSSSSSSSSSSLSASTLTSFSYPPSSFTPPASFSSSLSPPVSKSSSSVSSVSYSSLSPFALNSLFPCSSSSDVSSSSFPSSSSSSSSPLFSIPSPASMTGSSRLPYSSQPLFSSSSPYTPSLPPWTMSSMSRPTPPPWTRPPSWTVPYSSPPPLPPTPALVVETTAPVPKPPPVRVKPEASPTPTKKRKTHSHSDVRDALFFRLLNDRALCEKLFGTQQRYRRRKIAMLLVSLPEFQKDPINMNTLCSALNRFIASEMFQQIPHWQKLSTGPRFVYQLIPLPPPSPPLSGS